MSLLGNPGNCAVMRPSKLSVRFCLFFYCAAIAGCNDSGGKSENEQPVANTAAVSSANSSAGGTNAAVGETALPNAMSTSEPGDPNLQYYPPSNYRKYPPNVRSLIRQADMENDHCRGTFEGAETYRACNRLHQILLALEKLGWCWGGSDYGYKMHWLRCADDPGYKPGQLRTEPPYTDKDIEEAKALPEPN